MDRRVRNRRYMTMPYQSKNNAKIEIMHNVNENEVEIEIEASTVEIRERMNLDEVKPRYIAPNCVDIFSKIPNYNRNYTAYAEDNEEDNVSDANSFRLVSFNVLAG